MFMFVQIEKSINTKIPLTLLRVATLNSNCCLIFNGLIRSSVIFYIYSQSFFHILEYIMALLHSVLLSNFLG